MSYSLVFHPLAEKEYLEAYLYYEIKKPGLGERFEQAIDFRLKRIQAKPGHYKTSHRTYREASVDIFPFVIVYKITRGKNRVYVVSVYHTKRNPKHKFRK